VTNEEEDDNAPEPSPSAAEFFDALDAGDAALAASILRNLDCLRRDDLELLADLLDGGQPPAQSRYRLIPRARVGRPPSLAKRTASQKRARLVKAALDEGRNLKSAIPDVAKAQSVSTSTVRRDWRKHGPNIMAAWDDDL
jgi:hypothetical protein